MGLLHGAGSKEHEMIFIPCHRQITVKLSFGVNIGESVKRPGLGINRPMSG